MNEKRYSKYDFNIQVFTDGTEEGMVIILTDSEMSDTADMLTGKRALEFMNMIKNFLTEDETK